MGAFQHGNCTPRDEDGNFLESYSSFIVVIERSPCRSCAFGARGQQELFSLKKGNILGMQI